jgi:hypothetical protein
MPRYVAVISLAAIILIAGIVLARGPLRGRITRMRDESVATARQLTVKPDSVAWSGIYQRFRSRRDAVAAMQADLNRLLVAESAFVADSGLPTAFLPLPYAFPPSKGNRPPEIVLRPDGWSATIVNDNTSISCSITVSFVSETSYAPPYIVRPACTAGRATQP